MEFNERFIQQFGAGETVFAQGSEGHVMYVVLAGRIELRHAAAGVERVIASLAEGEIFGEMALVDSGIRSASAVAVADTRLVVIDQARFVYIVSQQPAFALCIMRVMAQRIQARRGAAQ